MKLPFYLSAICSSLFIYFLSTTMVFGQNEPQTLVPKNATTARASANQAHTIYSVPTGTQNLPEALGGGEMKTQSLMVTSSTFRGGTELTPAQFDAVSLHPGRWLDDGHFLFIASDEVDIQDYYLYVVAEDRAYPVDFELGESVGYMEIETGSKVNYKLEGEKVIEITFSN